MSLLGALLIRPKRFPASSNISWDCASSPRFTSSVGRAKERWRGPMANVYDDRQSKTKRRATGASQTVEDVFIAALVTASSCAHCPRSTRVESAESGAGTATKRRRRQLLPNSLAKRAFSTKPHHQQSNALAAVTDFDAANTVEEGPVGVSVPRKKYENLANTYPPVSDFLKRAATVSKKPARRALPDGYQPLAPRLVLTPEQEMQPPYARRRILRPESREHAEQLDRFKKLLAHRDLKDKTAQLWRSYQMLPTPRPRYLSDHKMREILRNLAWVEFKSLQSSRRYFSILEECIGEGVQLTAHEWNTAISFAGRWVKHTRVDEVKAAVETWMLMENQGVAADNVTFNILFDVAIRAGRFALADTIYEELKARDMPLNRLFRTSVIYYAGLRRDGDAVRQAFRELVNAGEIVDTAIMNCVILSLVRSGEGASAEDVFARMKELHSTKFGTKGPQGWSARRKLGRELNQTAIQLRKGKAAHEASFFGSLYSTEEKKEQAQRAAPIHPDDRTCEILIRYHALTSGDLGRAQELVEEIRAGGWHIHGKVYLAIFRGFLLYGGSIDSKWNRSALQLLWTEFLNAVVSLPARPLTGEAEEADMSDLPTADAADMEPHEDFDRSYEQLAPFFTPALVLCVLNAFYKCAGAKRMLEAWAQVQEKWQHMTAEERERIQATVQKLKAEDEMYIR